LVDKTVGADESAGRATTVKRWASAVQNGPESGLFWLYTHKSDYHDVK
jgi:hypothetical protein